MCIANLILRLLVHVLAHLYKPSSITIIQFFNVFIQTVPITLVFVTHAHSFSALSLGSNHYGIAGHYAIRASEEGLLVYITHISRQCTHRLSYNIMSN